MSGRRVSLALMMKVTALVAVNLAVVRTDAWVLSSPFFLFMLTALDVVLVQSVVLGRTLRAFHAAFLAVGAAYSIAATVLVYGHHFISPKINPARPAMGLVAGVLGLLSAWVAAGLLASPTM